MALDDLLRAIESDAGEERALADREATADAAAIVARARQEADALEEELTTAPEADAHAEAERDRALARLDATDTVRAAREAAYTSVLDGIRAVLTALRGSSAYAAVFLALLAESRLARPSARELRVDDRDRDLAAQVADGLQVVASLQTWGGVELADAEGRPVGNTLEERLANADMVIRRRFAAWLATPPGTDATDAR